ncbi:UNVERIFIED_CONTAM: hypothetical protein O8I53_06485 [Campylobacter lari]
MPVDEQDLEQFLYTKNETREEPNGKIYNIDSNHADKILNIDNYFKNLGLSTSSLLNLINNSEIKAERYNIIRNRAYEVTTNNIINQVDNLVGKENIGLRETLTVDGINAENKQNIFHFINVGNEKGKIDDVKLNVGKLYNEESNPTALTKS